MKLIITYLFFICVSNILIAQTKYYTKSGNINFEASVPSFEEVKAKNNTVTSILNINTGEIAALALVKGFRFKVALMEEHFNESFAESFNFPKATFIGKIDDFSMNNLTEEYKPFYLNGELTFHGKTVQINPEAYISLNNNKLYLKSSFILNPEQFDIKIPKIVQKKVAETVEVTFNFMLVPKS